MLKEGDSFSLTRYLGDARRFGTEDEAIEFAFGDRPRRGNTEVVKVSEGCSGVPVRVGQDLNLTRHLGLKPTSLLENNDLWSEMSRSKSFFS